MKQAGLMVGIDLENPVDLSQMRIFGVYEETKLDEYYRYSVLRVAELHAFTVNEHGQQDELTITITLKSDRRPKPETYA